MYPGKRYSNTHSAGNQSSYVALLSPWMRCTRAAGCTRARRARNLGHADVDEATERGGGVIDDRPRGSPVALEETQAQAQQVACGGLGEQVRTSTMLLGDLIVCPEAHKTI